MIDCICFCGCFNKLPQTWYLKTAEMSSLKVLEDSSPKAVSLGPNQSIGRADSLWSL